MNVGPLGTIGAAAGSPLAQAGGSDLEKAQRDTAAQQRKTASAQSADSAAGIAEPDGQEHSSNERDADGRRLWEDQAPAAKSDSAQPLDDQTAQRKSKDPRGETGAHLDLTA